MATVKAIVSWIEQNGGQIILIAGVLWTAADLIIRLVLPAAKAEAWRKRGGWLKSKIGTAYLYAEKLMTFSRRGVK